MDGAAPTRPRLLFLCQNAPYPPHGGQQIKSLNTLRILARDFDVRVLAFFRRAIHPTEEHRERARSELSTIGPTELFSIRGEHDPARNVSDHAKSLISGRPYVWHGYRSPSFDRALRRCLRELRPDIVHLDTLDLARVLPELDLRRTVVSHHNIESQLLRRRARGERALLRPYLRLQADRLEALEREWCPKVAHNWVVSPSDGEALSRIAPGARWGVFPNGVDTSALTPAGPELVRDIDVIFVGGVTWFPNTDGMKFFAEEVMALLRDALGAPSVVWVGRASEEMKRAQAAHGIEMTGYVDDIRPWVSRAKVFVVPLRIGGGTRLKILDAWALGKAVVSTSIGCEGLEAKHDENIVVADSARAFADAIVRLVRDEDSRQRLERAARATAERLYDWTVIGDAVLPTYREILPNG